VHSWSQRTVRDLSHSQSVDHMSVPQAVLPALSAYQYRRLRTV
jgi:hypothetical protein